MNIDDLTIGDLKEMKSLISLDERIPQKNHEDPRNGTKQIIVLDRGWVVVGDFHYSNGLYTITNTSVIRFWGTTKGLGEIAKNGPTSKTVLDECGTVRTRTEVCTFTCSNKWG